MGPQRRLGIYIGFEYPSIIKYLEPMTDDQFTARKRGRPLGSKDANPRKRKEHIVSINHDANVTTSNVSEDEIPEVILFEDPIRNEQDLDDSYEMSINYAHNSLGWNRKEIKMNDIFAYSVAVEIMDEDDNDPQTMEECQHRNDWKSWKKPIQDELDSLNKREVFGPIIPTPKGVKLVDYKTESGFVIIAVYVDDLNIIGSPEEIRQAADYLKIRSLDVNKNPFHPPAHNDEILGPEVPYLSAIGALIYLANNTRPDIAFSVNLLARYSSTPTKRHWNGVKHILRYLRGTSDMGLYFERHENAKATNLVGYSDAGYLSDPYKAISQSGYVFMYGGTAISWRSTKQTLVATSSNHAELIALYEVGRECVWLRSLIRYVCESCGLEPIEKSPTVIYEDNAACIAQIKDGYIKGDRTKHISPKFFSTHELQVEGKVDVNQIPSSQNLADLFTKALPTKVFKQLIHNIGMRRLKDIFLN
ncbi:UNVERIFIED_CONTAM: Retrovirus-related Pol polyprotein from transposon TNT 1-94 [Sesamum calycinum]|uniref:Retrovirus-related Pol polyprotein from transposon TNT 1-94 n=1 Tax=Sesamum calycinum TaxID=2727403 RepID=A0AAW2N3W5_9LAMI